MGDVVVYLLHMCTELEKLHVFSFERSWKCGILSRCGYCTYMGRHCGVLWPTWYGWTGVPVPLDTLLLNVTGGEEDQKREDER